MKKTIMTYSAAFCGAVLMLCLGSCGNKFGNEKSMIDTVTVVIDLDSIVLRPFLPWDAMVVDLDNHMKANCSDWVIESADTLVYDEGTNHWKRTFAFGNLRNTYYFADAKGNYLKFVSFVYYGSMPLEPVVAEMDRNGLKLQGEIDFPGRDSEHCFLYLSPSGLLEVQVAGWKDGAWCITFQPTDPEDLKLLVGKDKGEAKP